MNKLNIIGLFCEDIREEKGEQFTLIGLMSDNINVNAIRVEMDNNSPSEESRLLSKLCIFARANFDPADPVKEIKLRLVFPDGHPVDIGGAEPEVLAKAKAQAKAKGNPLTGIIMRAVVVGVKLAQDGIMRLEADIDSETQLIASLNFNIAKNATSTTS